MSEPSQCGAAAARGIEHTTAERQARSPRRVRAVGYRAADRKMTNRPGAEVTRRFHISPNAQTIAGRARLVYGPFGLRDNGGSAPSTGPPRSCSRVLRSQRAGDGQPHDGRAWGYAGRTPSATDR